jgi:uncharacterized protein (DUF1015 family)
VRAHTSACQLTLSWELATLKPFQPYCYTSKAGDPANLLTQPYDKISPAMQAKYLAASPYNLVRLILGQRFASDNETDNVYTRAAKYLDDWIRDGILAQDAQPGFYAYFQEFEVPDTRERANRMGFIGLGKVEDYSAHVVFRHEQTLSGPKKDRREVLNHTGSHFGQIFMLYRDREAAIDQLLEQAALSAPVLDVLDDYQARHRLWPITDSSTIQQIQDLMADKKLLIADGHHRYETALGYRNDHPDVPAAEYVMMTFVNMYSPGLKILATHRVVRNLERFDVAAFLEKAGASGWTATLPGSQPPGPVRIGVVTADSQYQIERPRKEGELDVPVLHTEILGGFLGINEEAVREEKHITYVRGVEAAVAEVRGKGAQVAFLLEPTPIEDMARIAFGGGVMPQKSTDFYPKLLSGVTIYRL